MHWTDKNHIAVFLLGLLLFAGEALSSSSGARHKVIQVSLQQDVKLHTAENAWKPVGKKDTTTTDDDEDLATAVTTTCRSTLQGTVVLGLHEGGG